jgi:enamine deaminase RidA (YjgF/YER057c/UK114 family)
MNVSTLTTTPLQTAVGLHPSNEGSLVFFSSQGKLLANSGAVAATQNVFQQLANDLQPHSLTLNDLHKVNIYVKNETDISLIQEAWPAIGCQIQPKFELVSDIPGEESVVLDGFASKSKRPAYYDEQSLRPQNTMAENVAMINKIPRDFQPTPLQINHITFKLRDSEAYAALTEIWNQFSLKSVPTHSVVIANGQEEIARVSILYCLPV